jgi:hypothetical protein
MSIFRSMVAIAPVGRASHWLEIKRNYGRAKRPAEKGGVCAVVPGGNRPLICCGVVPRKLCELDRYAKRSEKESSRNGIIKSFGIPKKMLPNPLSKRKFGQQKNESNYPAGKERARRMEEGIKVLNARDIHESRTEDAGYRRDPERNTRPL